RPSLPQVIASRIVPAESRCADRIRPRSAAGRHNLDLVLDQVDDPVNGDATMILPKQQCLSP
ncbi:MAG TPA: hypothetical protein VGX76_01265, partial [Pirellulales bacterium]|nr:hypothetical protein [Pirellulales bacterium]